jgi:hypothetical protein
MKKIVLLGSVLGVISPMFVFAAGPDAFSIINILNILLSWIIPVLITLAVIYFIWGVLQYILSKDEETKKGGRTKIINGLIGLFVIVAFWGIIALITNTFGVGPEQLTPDAIPCIPGPGVSCGF